MNRIANRWLGLLCIQLALASLSSLAIAQETKPIAVVALDDNEGSAATATQMAEVLVAGDKEVVYGDQVFARIGDARVEVGPDVAQEFSGISERVAKGVKAFFYEGYDEAVEQLAPILQLGIKRFAYVAQRPDIAAQLYEAGLVLIRAYDGRDQPEDARATARILVQYFPARKPTLDSSPPEVIELIRSVRGEIEDEKAMLGVKPLGEGTCNAFINGSRVGDGFFPVASDKPVYTQVECDGVRGPLWKVQVPQNTRIIAPVPMGRIADLKMPDDSFESRRAAENVMTAVQFWGGFSEIVGIRHPETEGDAPTLFGHLRQGSVTWTETNDIPALVGYVQRTFDVDSDRAYATLNAEDEDSGPSTPIDWVSWSLVGGGVASAATGVVLIILGNADKTQIICSNEAITKPSSGQCDGVENIGPLTESEFDDRVSSADTKLVLGYTLTGLGAAALGYGIYRLITNEPESAAQATISPRDGGFEAGFQLKF